MFRLEDVASHLVPMPGLMRQICDRAKTKVRKKGLPLTREIYDAQLKLDCFKAGVLFGTELELESLPNWYKDALWTNVGSKVPDATIVRILRDIYSVALRPALSEADRSASKQMWAEGNKEAVYLQALVRQATQTQQMQRMP
jgi:hypothetical protein